MARHSEKPSRRGFLRRLSEHKIGPFTLDAIVVALVIILIFSLLIVVLGYILGHVTPQTLKTIDEVVPHSARDVTQKTFSTAACS
ncbi:MAG: hypothetical protein ACOYJL_02330 [Tractidigestivibacter sp.]|jgi:hypothetical protein|uniref:hypothetical protein n=1 Tax=Tractidigestivibacter sp. TaxID=2847320 RepID=UPI003D8EB0C0